MANILIGRTGGGSTFQPLIERLRSAGYQVTERSSSPIGAHGSSDDAEGVDFVFLVVRDGDDVSAVGPVRPFQRVARDAGVLQGKVGMDRVILLVEDSVAGLTSDLGVGVMRYPKGHPEAAFENIRQRIERVSPAPATGIHRKLTMVERSRADNVFAPFLLFGFIALLALIGALVVASSWVGGEDGRAELIDVTDALRPGAVTSAELAGGGESSAGSVVAGSDAGVAPDPASPSVALDGDNQLFPATCEIILADGSAIPDATPCAGAGVLMRDGSAGPWHNELGLLALSDGVVGQLVYEDGQVQALEPGVIGVDENAVALGLSSVTLTFSASGQHVHLREGDGSRSRETTLTLQLDR